MRSVIERVEVLRERLGRGGSLRDCVVRGLDLRGLDLGERDGGDPGRSADSAFASAVFLGCRVDDALLSRILAAGGAVLPPLPDLPYEPYRATLYRVEELMAGYRPEVADSFHTDTVDARIYRHFMAFRQQEGSGSLVERLAQTLHDHGMDEALYDLLFRGERPHRVVGIMGGHGMTRDDPMYAEVARLAWRLGGAGFTVATGGGPGAMEAGNLGAFFAPASEEILSEALARLARVPSWKDPRWIASAGEVRDLIPEGGESVAIPTWYYGHEPTNLFARHVAKYFANSLREDVLVSVALHGIVFTPGSAGTVQEIFADATQNHYGTQRVISPMVFLGSDWWTRQLPVLPLLERLAGFRRYRSMVSIQDRGEDALSFLVTHPPVPWEEG